ncbi:MAG: hypothetical protein IPK25_16135 [Saprospiraceae bacterium]|nr:hypothetical protein [Saprospiraceae bacterium]
MPPPAVSTILRLNIAAAKSDFDSVLLGASSFTTSTLPGIKEPKFVNINWSLHFNNIDSTMFCVILVSYTVVQSLSNGVWLILINFFLGKRSFFDVTIF